MRSCVALGFMAVKSLLSDDDLDEQVIISEKPQVVESNKSPKEDKQIDTGLLGMVAKAALSKEAPVKKEEPKKDDPKKPEPKKYDLEKFNDFEKETVELAQKHCSEKLADQYVAAINCSKKAMEDKPDFADFMGKFSREKECLEKNKINMDFMKN